MKAVISYARLPEKELLYFKQELDKRLIHVSAVVTHSGELKHGRKILPQASFYVIDDYNNAHAWDAKSDYFDYTRPLKYKADWTSPLDLDLYNQIVLPNLQMYLPIVERFVPYEGGSMEAETRLLFDFSKAHEIIRELKPDILLFYLEPQTGLENMLYVLGKHFNIPCIVVRVGIFRHSCGVSLSYDAPLLDEAWNPHPDTLVVGNEIDAVSGMHPRTKQLIEKIQDTKQKYKAGYMYGLNLIKSPKELIKHSWKSKVDWKRWWMFGVNPPFGNWFKYKLYQKYRSAMQPIPSHNDGPVLYFPLHYQPELNTMPRGKEFVNQLKVLKLLSDHLPPGGIILVKEHHGVFSRTHFTNQNFRPSTYYNWMRRMPNVYLVSDDIHTVELQNRCDYVVTVTGNAGLEAMVRGKKVLHFGIASYSNGPGVYRIKHGFDLERVFAMNKNEETILPDVIPFIQAIDKVCYHTDANMNSASFDDQRLIHWINTLMAGFDVFMNKNKQTA